MDVTWNALVSGADGQLSPQQSGEPGVSVLRCGHCTLNCTTPAGNVGLGEKQEAKGFLCSSFCVLCCPFPQGQKLSSGSRSCCAVPARRGGAAGWLLEQGATPWNCPCDFLRGSLTVP